MTGTTNQVQTPMSSGVRTILANAVNTANGCALTPSSPGSSFTGTFPGCMFTVWEAASLAGGSYTPLVLGQYNSRAANGTITAQPFCTVMDFGTIQQLNNALSGAMPTITTITANSLVQMSSDFNLTTVTVLSTLTMPLLKYIGGNFSATSAPALTSVSLSSLVAVNGSVSPIYSAATSIDLSSLVYIGNGLSLSAALCTSINLSSLQHVYGAVGISMGLSILTTLNLPALVGVYGSSGINLGGGLANNLATFSMGSGLKVVGGNVSFSGCALNQASVDGVLVSLAALDGTGGTTAYSSKTVTLSGGTNATPSATGLAAKAVLVGRGCTVNNN
jgi:hypothetical protein